MIAQIPGGPNGAALGPDGKVYICNNGGYHWVQIGDAWAARPPRGDQEKGGSIQRVDLTSGNVETLFTDFEGVPLNAPNDLVFDRHGGLWFTDMGKSRDLAMDHGALYYISPDFSELRQIASPLLGPNGIGLSPDEKTVYVAEMPPARLWAFDLSEPGVVARLSGPFAAKKGAASEDSLVFACSIRSQWKPTETSACDNAQWANFGILARRETCRTGGYGRSAYVEHCFWRSGHVHRLHYAKPQGRPCGITLAAARFASQLFGLSVSGLWSNSRPRSHRAI